MDKDIEITDEMLRAGIEALEKIGPHEMSLFNADDVARGIYSAMRALEKPSLEMMSAAREFVNSTISQKNDSSSS